MNASAHGRIAAHHSWAATPDRAARGQEQFRRGLGARFEREARENLGPDAPDAAIAAAAESLRKAHFVWLAAQRQPRKAS